MTKGIRNDCQIIPSTFECFNNKHNIRQYGILLIRNDKKTANVNVHVGRDRPRHLFNQITDALEKDRNTKNKQACMKLRRVEEAKKLCQERKRFIVSPNPRETQA